jgi:rifampicin phosphotransferase
MRKYYNFKQTDLPDISLVGGKAQSLIKLINANFNVPDGAVLSVGFFDDWINALTKQDFFSNFDFKSGDLLDLSVKLKNAAKALSFSESQTDIVDAILKAYGKDGLYAVRSSSPEEDLAGASFAGGYETILGVSKDMMFDAIKKAFISCLDERVFFYKKQNGFDVSFIRIAVIIQRQIKSDVSGVGFSLNPLNNCFDEAVINSNTGLGESVVSGMVTPDEFIVDKKDLSIISKQLGSKEKAIIINTQNKVEVVNGQKTESSLSHSDVKSVTRLIASVEDFYGFPVDIEWAICDDEIFLLQSRPITTFIPLPAEICTDPNEQRKLYIDGSLVKQGITTPITVLGCDCLEKTQAIMFKSLMGKDVTSDPIHGMAATKGGRMYVNLSTTMKMQGVKKAANTWRFSDGITAKMIETNDMTPYMPKKQAKIMKGVMFGAIKNNMGTMKYILKAKKDASAYKAWYQPFEDNLDAYLKDVVRVDLPLSSLVDEIFEAYILLLEKMLPMTYAAELSRSSIKKILTKHGEDALLQMKYMERSLPDNVTIDMGLSLYALSQMSEIKTSDFETFSTIISSGDISDAFSKAWQDYIDDYGCRTSNELDIGVIRPYEDIEVIFNQAKSMCELGEDQNPITIFKQSKQLREQNFEKLMALLKPSDAKKIRKAYGVLVALGGKREALKYWYIKSLDAVRKIIMLRADGLVKKQKIESRDDIIWLTITQIEKAINVPKQQVDGWINEQKKYYTQLNRIKHFPKIIDSRGKILTYKRESTRKNEIVGQPISPGVVTGRVKVLNTPTEKPLLAGEIMVTTATDPGWTPLFINASAILLEVGGLLQHGALVAREYGKPCVAGIAGIMDIFKDGQLVEVNATEGVVRILEDVKQ